MTVTDTFLEITIHFITVATEKIEVYDINAEVFYRKTVLKLFVKITNKHLRRSSGIQNSANFQMQRKRLKRLFWSSLYINL